MFFMVAFYCKTVDMLPLCREPAVNKKDRKKMIVSHGSVDKVNQK
jgi:hypothetical protein